MEAMIAPHCDKQGHDPLKSSRSGERVVRSSGAGGPLPRVPPPSGGLHGRIRQLAGGSIARKLPAMAAMLRRINSRVHPLHPRTARTHRAARGRNRAARLGPGNDPQGPYGVVLRNAGAALVLPPVAQYVSLQSTACEARSPPKGNRPGTGNGLPHLTTIGPCNPGGVHTNE